MLRLLYFRDYSFNLGCIYREINQKQTRGITFYYQTDGAPPIFA